MRVLGGQVRNHEIRVRVTEEIVPIWSPITVIMKIRFLTGLGSELRLEEPARILDRARFRAEAGRTCSYS